MPNYINISKILRLLYDFSFLPPKVFASAFSAFNRRRGVSCTALSADFHIESMLLSESFFKRIRYWHTASSLFAAKTHRNVLNILCVAVCHVSFSLVIARHLHF
jgi:hypothetical protein